MTVETEERMLARQAVSRGRDARAGRAARLLRGHILASAILPMTLACSCPAFADASPRVPDSAALRRMGVRVAWPLPAATELPANDTITVTVASRSRRVTVTLAKMTAAGVAFRTIDRRRVRNGRVQMRLPATVEAHYALRLTVGGHRYWSAIRTTCPERGTDQASLSLSADSGHAGDAVTLVATNTGTSCLAADKGYGWQRAQADGTWIDVPPPDDFTIQPIGFVVYPQQSFVQPVRVWPTTPGRYRVVKWLGAVGPLTAEYNIVA